MLTDEGQVTNPADFSRRLNNLLVRLVASPPVASPAVESPPTG
jgi:hypothetical protein